MEKSSISTFQELFASIDKIFILGVRLSTRLWFYEVLRFSWFFLIFWDPKVSSWWAACREIWIYFVYCYQLCFILLFVDGKFGQTSNIFQILWQWFYVKFDFNFM